MLRIISLEYELLYANYHCQKYEYHDCSHFKNKNSHLTDKKRRMAYYGSSHISTLRLIKKLPILGLSM